MTEGRRPKNPEFAQTRNVREMGRNGKAYSLEERVASVGSIEDLEATVAELPPDMFVHEDGTPLMAKTADGERFQVDKFFVLSQVQRVRQGTISSDHVLPLWGIKEKLKELGF